MPGWRGNAMDREQAALLLAMPNPRPHAAFLLA
jgi:hypothetical protein